MKVRFFFMATGLLVASVAIAQLLFLPGYKGWSALLLAAGYIAALLVIALFAIFKKDSNGSRWSWLFWAAPLTALAVITPVVLTGGLYELSSNVFGAWGMAAALFFAVAVATPVLFFVVILPLKTLLTGIFVLIFSKKRSVSMFPMMLLSLIPLLLTVHIVLGVLAIEASNAATIIGRTWMTVATVLGFDAGLAVRSEAALFASRASLIATALIGVGILVADRVGRSSRLERSRKVERRDDIKG